MSTSKENIDDDLYEDDFDLIQLLEVIWKGKIFIIAMTAVISLGSIFYALSLTNYFTSESVLVSRDSQSSGSISQLSGLASFAGLSGISGEDNSTFKMMEIIKSRDFVKHLVTFENILPSILAADYYEPKSRKLYFDAEVYDTETKSWVKRPDENELVTPSYLEAHREYQKMVTVTQDKITRFVSIKVEHMSPVFAQEFLSLIIKEANNLNRKKDIENSREALDYLKLELSKTSLLDIKNSINQLIEGQLETQMMASIYDEYSLIVLEPPFVPEKRSRPTRSLIVIFSTLVGGILSVIVVLIREFTSGKL